MSVSRLFLSATLVSLFSASIALAQANPAPQGGQSTEKPVQYEMPLYVPGFWQLSQESVQKEIDIVPDQLDKLKLISKEFLLKQREIYTGLQNADMTPDERTAAYAEMNKKAVELNEKYSGRVKDVLLPHQIKALEDIDFRNRAGMMLQWPQYVEKLNLTPEQKAQVKKNRDELAKKIQKANQEALDEVLQTLTPEQIDILKQPWPGQGGQGWGRAEAPKK
jgi:Spy/CpxP family protein refolding chaperone